MKVSNILLSVWVTSIRNKKREEADAAEFKFLIDTQGELRLLDVPLRLHPVIQMTQEFVLNEGLVAVLPEKQTKVSVDGISFEISGVVNNGELNKPWLMQGNEIHFYIDGDERLCFYSGQIVLVRSVVMFEPKTTSPSQASST